MKYLTGILCIVLLLTAHINLSGQRVSRVPTSRQAPGLNHPGRHEMASGVTPLLPTRWGEGCFYNASCPVDTASHATCLHTPAGAGAVAMAQIMKYYQYPAHGTGEHGYQHPKYGIQYANFGATSYMWSAMPDSLSALNDGLALLIYQCGVAQDMNYGTASSSSLADALDTALVRYFGYPSSASWKQRSGYSHADWLAMLKAELDASHPLIFYGTDLTGLVQDFFICDGYAGDSLFHINWGKGGAFDGYYSVNNLNPGTANYSYNQQVLFDLTPVSPTPDTYTMDFENVADFSLTFNDWTARDMDLHDTYGITNYTFSHMNEPMAFLCFNPSQVIPSMSGDAAIQPHGGQRFGACFSSNPPSNDDWLISPQIQLETGGSFSYWAKSYNDLYGVDDYLVAVSTTDSNPASFVTISGADTLHTTTAWTRKTFSLAAFNNQKVYVAIHCVSKDHFLMMVDDIVVKTKGSSAIAADFTAAKTTLTAGESVSFTDLSSGGPTSWVWTFTGATPAVSTQQNPEGITYNTPGTYPVSLKVSNGMATDSVTKEGFITVSGFPSSMSLDFESLADFTLDFRPWITKDVKKGNTYGIQNITFPNNYLPMAYICFNPTATTPALTNMQAHSGLKMACCFSTVPSQTPPAVTPNDKWLISPRMSLGLNPKIEFWVKTYSTQFGNELYNVAVSTTDTSASGFTAVNTATEYAPSEWTKKSYDLSAYAGQNVYIGIQCVTNDGFIFMLDDISITSTVGIHEYGRDGWFSLGPNPARDFMTLRSFDKKVCPAVIRVINVAGKTVRKWDVPAWNDLTLDVRDLPQGFYILRVSSGDETVNRKFSVIH